MSRYFSRYSSREGRWYGRRFTPLHQPTAEPDDREWHTQLPNGMLVVEFGNPVRRLPCEPQPVLVKGSLGAAKAMPEPSCAEPTTPPSDRSKSTHDPREWKPGLGRD